MRIHEATTDLRPADVISRARAFFSRVRSPYATFAAHEGASHLRLSMDVGEMVIGAIRAGDVTRVRGSASRGGWLVTRFLATLPSPCPDCAAVAKRAAA